MNPGLPKKINKAPSVMAIVISNDHRHLGGTLKKVLIEHQHQMSLNCKILLSYSTGFQVDPLLAIPLQALGIRGSSLL